jgi:competence protein ComEA
MRKGRRRWLIVMLSAGLSRSWAQPRLLEVNLASRAELESLPGLGPSLVDKLLTARSQASFSDWADLLHRVHGIGPAKAKKLAAFGLRVNGLAYPD